MWTAKCGCLGVTPHRLSGSGYGASVRLGLSMERGVHAWKVLFAWFGNVKGHEEEAWKKVFPERREHVT